MAPETPSAETEAAAPCGWPRALLAGFRAGEREALAEVYRRHAQEVATLLRAGFSFRQGESVHRFVGFASAFDLHDALHDTFVRAFSHRARTAFDGIRPFSPYLATIAKNVVLARFRAQQALFVARPGAIEAEVEAGDPSSEPHDDPELALHRRRLAARVEAFVAGLTEGDRALLYARFVDGLSQRDAAEALGIGRQRLRTRELRLKDALLRHVLARGERPELTWALSLLGTELARAMTEGLR